jgi:peptidoglycan/xylan/chitin deacetylase (PgdA/CDA1 family)
MTDITPFWPEGIQGAVSLTFDDALESQLTNALPLLDGQDLKGTFYVNPEFRPSWEAQIPRWQLASRNGHEIGNHTTRHPCSCNFGFSADYCLEKLGLADIEATIEAAEKALNVLFPEQQGKRSFCYPCYQSYVGAGIHRQSYVPLVARRFKVGRGGGERANNPRLIDLSYVWAWAVEGRSGDEIIDFVEKAVERESWGIICMHGINDEHLAIDIDAFSQLVVYLGHNKERIWTDTVIGLADYILTRRQKMGETHGA